MTYVRCLPPPTQLALTLSLHRPPYRAPGRSGQTRSPTAVCHVGRLGTWRTCLGGHEGWDHLLLYYLEIPSGYDVTFVKTRGLPTSTISQLIDTLLTYVTRVCVSVRLDRLERGIDVDPGGRPCGRSLSGESFNVCSHTVKITLWFFESWPFFSSTLRDSTKLYRNGLVVK